MKENTNDKPARAGAENGKDKPAGNERNGAPRRKTAREVALEVLTKVDENAAYSNLLLNRTLQKYGLERSDAALATEIVYGTIQRLNTIDYFLRRFVSAGLEKLQPWVRCLLRLSFYQLVYLERIPDHAAVNEAVNLAKKKGHQGIAGMVNGVLRTVIRQKEQLTLPAGLTDVQRISLQHSHPEWLVARWVKQFGPDTTERICQANNEAPKVSVRVNKLKRSREEMLRLLEQEGLDVEPSNLAPAGVVIKSGGNMAHTDWFSSGDISIQDESSMLVAELVDPRPGMRVLDCCAAPGGKTAHLAENMNDQGTIWATDLHEHKRKLIEDQAKRLKLQSIRTLTCDARKLGDHFEPESFDRILLDAPCSGFGVIRRKPDLKWSKKPGDVKDICTVQRDILESVHRLLRPGGILVYSTCTIEYEENQGMVERFLQEHPEFVLDASVDLAASNAFRQKPFTGMVQILPHQFRSDGFFIARLRKK